VDKGFFKKNLSSRWTSDHPLRNEPKLARGKIGHEKILGIMHSFGDLHELIV
jgi:hypothetical protein